MTDLVGLPLETALLLYDERGIERPEVVVVRGKRAREGEYRVLRAEMDGRRLLVAPFPRLAV